MAEEQQRLRFSVIVLPPHHATPTTFFTLEEDNLCGGPVCTTDIRIKARFLNPVEECECECEGECEGDGDGEGKVEEFNLPSLGGHCLIEGSYFIFGGYHYRSYLSCSCDCDDSSLVIKASSSRPVAGPWTVRAHLPPETNFFLPVPYRRKIYLFGCPGQDVLVFDPQTDEYSAPVSMPERFGMDICMSYFLWNQKIVLLYRSHHFDKVKLLSYDVGAECWEEFDRHFPWQYQSRNPPLLLPGTDTLLIMDMPDSWRIYNVSDRKLTGETVRVEGMRGDPYQDVLASFCRASSSGSSFLGFAFIEGTYGKGIAYAKIRLRPLPKGEKVGYAAAVESQGDVKVGPKNGVYIFAEPSTKRKASSPRDPYVAGDI